MTGTFTKSAYTLFYQNTDHINDDKKPTPCNNSVEIYMSDSSSSNGAPHASKSPRSYADKNRRYRSVSHHRPHRTASLESVSDDYVTPFRSNYPRKENTYAHVDEPRTSTPLYSPPPVHYDRLRHTIDMKNLRNANYHPMHRK